MEHWRSHLICDIEKQIDEEIARVCTIFWESFEPHYLRYVAWRVAVDKLIAGATRYGIGGCE